MSEIDIWKDDPTFGNHQTWLICGGRRFDNEALTFDSLNALAAEHGWPLIVVEGGARGADALGALWARRNGIRVMTVHAQWTKYGNAAGPIRNRQMIKLHRPHLVVAFPGGKGTANMVEQAEKEKIEVIKISANGRRVLRLPNIPATKHVIGL